MRACVRVRVLPLISVAHLSDIGEKTCTYIPIFPLRLEILVKTLFISGICNSVVASPWSQYNEDLVRCRASAATEKFRP